MARGVNKVILIGNLGSDPEVKYTPNGAPVANFSLATNESWNDKDGQRQERTEWHRLVLWSKLAEIAGQYLKKGAKIYVEGRLQTRSWDDQSGQKRYMTEVVVNDMQMLDSRGEGGGSGYGDEGGSRAGGGSGYGDEGGSRAGGGSDFGDGRTGGGSGDDGDRAGTQPAAPPPPGGDDDDLPF